MRASVIHDERLIVCSLLLPRFVFLRVSLRLLPLLFHTPVALRPALLLPCGQRQGKHLLRLRPMRSIAPWRDTNPLTGYEPKLLDNFDCSETSEMIFQEESGDIDTELSYSCDAELDDEIFGKALSSPLFIQEREEPANLRQAYHPHEESLLPTQSRPVYEPSSSQKRNKSRHGERKNQDSP